MAWEWFRKAWDFYSEQINFSENDDKIKNMEAQYWDIIKEFLAKNKDEWWEQDISELAKALKNNKELSYYVLFLLKQQDLIFDDQIQLAKLKNELDRNVSAPTFEIFWWEAEVYKLKMKWFKVKWLEKDNIEISQIDVKEMPELWWYEITYNKFWREQKLYIKYEGRDKISFFDSYKNFLWYWDTWVKSREIEKWKYYRNWLYYQTRSIENVMVWFDIENIKLKLKFKFYDYN